MQNRLDDFKKTQEETIRELKNTESKESLTDINNKYASFFELVKLDILNKAITTQDKEKLEEVIKNNSYILELLNHKQSKSQEDLSYLQQGIKAVKCYHSQ